MTINIVEMELKIFIKYCVFVFFLFPVCSLNAQITNIVNQDSVFNENSNIRSVLKKNNLKYYDDTSSAGYRYYNENTVGKKEYFIDVLRNPNVDPQDFKITFRDTVIIDPMFLPIVFDGKLLNKFYFPIGPYNLGASTYPLYSPQKEITDRIKNEVPEIFPDPIDSAIRRGAYFAAIMTDYRIPKYTIAQMSGKIVQPEKLGNNIFEDLFKVENTGVPTSSSGIDTYKPKYRYWFLHGTNQIQFSQNYVSKNWYNGGNSNLNLNSSQDFTLNYKNGNIQFNNELQWLLSVYTNNNDTINRLKIGTDLIRTYSDFGVVAFHSKWSYSTNLELKTQLFRSYMENSKTRTSSFLSPFYANFGLLGMKYQYAYTSKKDKYKNMSVDLALSPLSLKFIYVADPQVDPTRFGINPGKRSLTTLGSSINSNLRTSLMRGTTFNSRFRIFTDYKDFDMESENDLNIAINRFFSIRIYLYMRYDNSAGIQRSNNLGYWQMNQLLSFGFNYAW